MVVTEWPLIKSFKISTNPVHIYPRYGIEIDAVMPMTVRCDILGGAKLMYMYLTVNLLRPKEARRRYTTSPLLLCYTPGIA